MIRVVEHVDVAEFFKLFFCVHRQYFCFGSSDEVSLIRSEGVVKARDELPSTAPVDVAGADGVLFDHLIDDDLEAIQFDFGLSSLRNNLPVLLSLLDEDGGGAFGIFFSPVDPGDEAPGIGVLVHQFGVETPSQLPIHTNSIH